MVVLLEPASAIAEFCRTGCGDTEEGSCLKAECPLREYCPLPLLIREKGDVGARLRLLYWRELQRLRGERVA